MLALAHSFIPSQQKRLWKNLQQPENVIEVSDVPHILMDHETETRPEPEIHHNLQGLVPFDSCLKGRPKFSVSLTSQDNAMS